MSRKLVCKFDSKLGNGPFNSKSFLHKECKYIEIGPRLTGGEHLYSPRGKHSRDLVGGGGA